MSLKRDYLLSAPIRWKDDIYNHEKEEKVKSYLSTDIF